MKWYSTILKRITKGIVLFLLPIMLVLFLFEKVIELVRKLIDPMKSILPENRIFGIGMITFFAILVILLICYFAGRRAEKRNLKSFLLFFEENILVFIPGHPMVKSTANETIGDENEGWKFGIEVEQHHDGFSTVFFPEPLNAK